MEPQPKRRREDDKAPPRRARPTLAATLLGRLVDGATRRQGFADSRLVTDWPAVVGAELAADTMPLKLDRRTRLLTLKVRPATALLVQHEEPRILERINAFFGTEVALRLRLVQGTLPRPATRPPPAPLPAAELAAIDAAVAPVPAEELRAALRDLGVAVGQRRRALATDGTT